MELLSAVNAINNHLISQSLHMELLSNRSLWHVIASEYLTLPLPEMRVNI